MSNFVTLLLVQAPNASRAARARYLWMLWLASLQRQYKNNESLLTLGLVRMSTWDLQNLGDNFKLPVHVAQPPVDETSLTAAQVSFHG